MSFSRRLRLGVQTHDTVPDLNDIAARIRAGVPLGPTEREWLATALEQGRVRPPPGRPRGNKAGALLAVMRLMDQGESLRAAALAVSNKTGWESSTLEKALRRGG